MSEDQVTQTVVEKTDAQPAAGAEAGGARTDGGDLDTLLNQYDQETSRPAAPKPEPKPPAAPAATIQPDPAITEIQQVIFRQDMDKLITAVRGDTPADVFDDEMVESWVDAQARKDPRLRTAWTQRHANPRQFEQVKTALGKEFAKKVSKMPDRQATEDREAVAAAVRGASGRAPEGKAPDYSKMTDAEFAKVKDQMYGG